MVIHSLALQNFRSYKIDNFEFSNTNIIYGNNGRGKTNLLEAIYLLTHLKSFRTNSFKNLLNFNEELAFLEANISLQNVHHKIKISLHKDKRKVWFDNKPVQFVSDYISRFFSLLFAPDMLSSFKNTPSERRNFMDRSLLLLSAQYSLLLRDYNHIKKQKKELLRTGIDKNITPWNKLLAHVSVAIKEQRKQLCNELNENITDLFQCLTKKKDILKINYKTNILDTEEAYFQFLEEKKDYEKQKGLVLYGAHRDTINITLNGQEEEVSLSQGEYRSSYLAIILGLNKILKEKKNILPIILLDDIFSELDTIVINRTIERLLPMKNQIFITSVVKQDASFVNMKEFAM